MEHPTRHHTGEDKGAFPAIAEEYPELRTDRNQLDWPLGETCGSSWGPSPRSRTRPRSPGEEKKLISVLNSMDVPEWRKNRPAFLMIDDPV